MRLLILSAALAAAAAGQDSKPTFGPPKKVEQTAPKAGDPVKPAGEKVPTLAEAIANAMTSNPDVRVAAAEVDLARARYEQTKVQIAAKLSSAHAAKSAAQQTIAALEKQFELLRAGHRAGNVSLTEMTTIELSLTQAKAALATANANYEALAGPPKSAATSTTGGVLNTIRFHDANEKLTTRLDEALVESVLRSAVRPVAVAPPQDVAEKLKAVLNRTVEPNIENIPAWEFLQWLKKATASDLVFKMQSRERVPAVTVTAGPITVGAMLQLVEDDIEWKGFNLYVREYGLLLCETKSAPDGAMTLQQFWQQVKDEKKPKPAGTTTK